MATPVLPNVEPASGARPGRETTPVTPDRLPQDTRRTRCARVVTTAALLALALVCPGCGDSAKEVVVRDAASDPQQRERDQEMVQRLRQQQGIAAPQQDASSPTPPAPPVSQ